MTDDSTTCGLSGERRAAIRQRLEQYPPCEAYQDETEDDPITVYVCGKCDRNEDAHIIRDLLAAVDQITLERDQWQRGYEALAAAVTEQRRRAEQAEAALVVLTQRQEWQPIETAPKDQSSVWGYTPYAFMAQGEMYYSVNHEQWERLPDEHVRPTHWMPLPDPPVGSTAPEDAPR